jgi:hypothetical protein
MEASGHARWFERLLNELQFELSIVVRGELHFYGGFDLNRFFSDDVLPPDNGVDRRSCEKRPSREILQFSRSAVTLNAERGPLTAPVNGRSKAVRRRCGHFEQVALLNAGA